jgi:vesicular inhibitory amino acid transporter
MYGQNLKSQVTLNLLIRKISTKIAIYTTLLNPLTKYAIIITPIATAIENKFYFGKCGSTISILIRTTLVNCDQHSMCGMHCTIFFGYVMVFVGASLSVTCRGGQINWLPINRLITDINQIDITVTNSYRSVIG